MFNKQYSYNEQENEIATLDLARNELCIGVHH